jgi:hypothetical protein
VDPLLESTDFMGGRLPRNAGAWVGSQTKCDRGNFIAADLFSVLAGAAHIFSAI